MNNLRLHSKKVRARVFPVLLASSNHFGVFAAHAVASIILAAMLALLVLDRQILVMVVESVQAGVFARDTLWGCLVHLGLWLRCGPASVSGIAGWLEHAKSESVPLWNLGGAAVRFSWRRWWSCRLRF